MLKDYLADVPNGYICIGSNAGITAFMIKQSIGLFRIG